MTATASPLMQRLDEMKRRYDEISAELSRPEVASDPEALQKYGREQSELSEAVARYEEYLRVDQELADANGMLDDGLDDEMRAFVRDETRRLESERETVSNSSACSRPYFWSASGSEATSGLESSALISS